MLNFGLSVSHDFALELLSRGELGRRKNSGDGGWGWRGLVGGPRGREGRRGCGEKGRRTGSEKKDGGGLIEDGGEA